MASQSSPSNPVTSAAAGSSSTPKKALNFSSPEAQSFVTIHCKGAVQPFRIHKNVITHYSPFFSAAFNSDFKEGQTQSMNLEDVEAPIFGLFNNWLYTQKFETVNGKRLKLLEYAKLWSLSQRFLMPALEAVLLKEAESTAPSSDAKSGSTLKDFQHYVYLVADQQVDSDLKRVVIKKTLSSVTKTNINKVLMNFPEGMLVDFTKALLEGCTKLRGWELGQGIEGLALIEKSFERMHSAPSGVAKRIHKKNVTLQA